MKSVKMTKEKSNLLILTSQQIDEICFQDSEGEEPNGG